MIAQALNSLFRGAATTVDLGNPRDPALARAFGLGQSTLAGYQVNEEKVLGFPAVWRGVNILANGAVKGRLQLMKRTTSGNEDDPAHMNYRCVTRKCSPDFSTKAYNRWAVGIAVLWGNACGHIVRDQNTGQWQEVIPLDPYTTHPIRVRGGAVDLDVNSRGELMYVTQLGGQMVKFWPDDILHIKGLGTNPYWGENVVELLRQAWGGIGATDESGYRFYGDGMLSSAVITYPHQLTKDAREEYQNNIQKQASGLGKAHRTFVLEQGATMVPWSVNPEQAQFLQGKEFNVRTISNALGVQSHKLGDPTRKSFNSLEQSNQEHLDDDLDPWLDRLEDEYEEKALLEVEKENDTHLIEVNRKALVRTNLEARAKFHQFAVRHGVYPPQQVNRIENMALVGSETLMVEQNMQPASALESPIVEPDNRMREAMQATIFRRVKKQAESKLSKSLGDYIEWLDGMPEFCETNEDARLCGADETLIALYNRLLKIVNSPIEQEQAIEQTRKELDDL